MSGLSFSEYGFLRDTYLASKEGKQRPFANTPSERALLDRGLIKVVTIKGSSPTGLIPSPMGDIPFDFAQITPRGRQVLREEMRQDGVSEEKLNRFFGT